MINLILSLSVMFCDLKGAVKNPGVYEIKENNIYEIINLAGGLTNDADLSYINLSKKVFDEMVIYIPSFKEKPKICPPCQCMEPKKCLIDLPKTTITTKPIISTTIPITTVVKLVNINSASKTELMTLNGIGEKVAEKIIEYRLDNSFKTIEDLLNVNGIGEATFAKIKDFITV